MAINVTSNANEIFAELGRTSARTTRRLAHEVITQGDGMADAWADAARARYGEGHGKLHPDRVKSHPAGFLAVDVYPEPEDLGLAYEFGGVNQPPHLDGQHTKDAREAGVIRALERILDDL